MFALELVIYAGIAIGLLYSALGLIFLAVERRRFRKLSDSRPKSFQAVTILKPLKGIDEDLENNLRTFFRLTYPEYQLVFGVGDIDDAAIDIVRNLTAEFPEVDAQLVINTFRIGWNPKVANLHNMYPRAKHDILVISDSNTRVQDDYLENIVACLEQPDTGLVTSVIRGAGASSIGAMMENMHLNGYIAGSVYTIGKIFGVPVTIGKSMCLRKETLRRLGGFSAFADVLLEDGLLGRGIKRMGLKIRHCFQPVENVNRYWSVRHFASRHLRWATMRRHLSLANYTTEILSNPASLALLLLIISPSITTLALAGGVVFFRIAGDIWSTRLLGLPVKFRQYALVLPKDLIIGLLWAVPFFRSTVVWRGNVLKVSHGTQVSPVAAGRAGLIGCRRITWASSAFSDPLSLAPRILKGIIRFLPKRLRPAREFG